MILYKCSIFVCSEVIVNIQCEMNVERATGVPFVSTFFLISLLLEQTPADIIKE